MTDTYNEQSAPPNPVFFHAFVTLVAIVTVISIGLFWLETSLHSLMLIAVLIAGTSLATLGYSFNEIRQAMNAGIKSALPAIYIFIMIGVLIAALIESGTLATLVYYGIEFISPALFLPAGLLLSSLMSLATGTSWGTVGTIGVVLVSIGHAMGIPAPVVAGVVVSGACFGDKMSPVSDTTNLASMSAKVDLYAHIKSMLPSSGAAYLLSMIIFTMMGLSYAEQPLPRESLKAMQTALSSTFNLSLWTLLPLLAMLALNFFRVAADLSMVITSVIAVVIAITFQNQDLGIVLNGLFSGGSVTTGLESIDSLLARGGIESMMWTLSLALMALALGGILEQGRFLQVLISTLIRHITRAVSLVTATVLSCFAANMAMGEAYMSIILGGQLFGDAYDDRGVCRRVLSRSLEEGATLTTALIPWTTAGAFFASALGVSVLDYAPWALLNWLSPLISIILAGSGVALYRIDNAETEV